MLMQQTPMTEGPSASFGGQATEVSSDAFCPTPTEQSHQILDRLSELHVVRSSVDLKREGRRKVLRFATEPAQKPVKRGKEERSLEFRLTPSIFDARKKMKRSLRSCLMKRRRKHGVTKRVRFSPSSPGTDVEMESTFGLSWESQTSFSIEDGMKKRAASLRARNKRFKEVHRRSHSPSSPAFRSRTLRERDAKPHPSIDVEDPGFVSRLHATVHSPPAPQSDDDYNITSMKDGGDKDENRSVRHLNWSGANRKSNSSESRTGNISEDSLK